MSRKSTFLVVGVFLALCTFADAVQTARIGSLHPKNGVVVTNVDLTAYGDYITVSNRAMGAMQSMTEWMRGEFTATNSFELTKDGFVYSIPLSPKYTSTLEYHEENGLSMYSASGPFWLTLYPSDAEQIGWGPKYGNYYRLSFPEESGTLALKSDVAAAQTKVAALDGKVATVEEDNASTRAIVVSWEGFLAGSNVVFSITNYMSGAYSLDTAKLKIMELRDGEYQEVYNSRSEILLHVGDATNMVMDAVNDALAAKADKAWGKYSSGGQDLAEAGINNTVYMTAPNTVFAGGMEYERVAVGEGAICVLTTRGAPVWTQGDEGTFKFQDDGGTNYFGFAKTDSYTIGANTDGITVANQIVTLTYNITMSGVPCVWYRESLTEGDWEQLNLSDGSAVAGASHAVTWEQNPPVGSEVCYINVGDKPKGFFKATVEVSGEAKFMTNMRADLSGGIVCPNTATGISGVIKPSFDGSNVIWTWSAD